MMKKYLSRWEEIFKQENKVKCLNQEKNALEVPWKIDYGEKLEAGRPRWSFGEQSREEGGAQT